MTTLSPTRPRLKVGAAVLLAAGLLAGSVAPSLAAPTWPQNQGFSQDSSNAAPSTATGFHRHFWRGSQLSKAPAQDVAPVALASEAEAEAMEAYCMDRFRSYDPATGTYLGYDGNEHACP
jgi:hypothetical protein